MKIVIISGSRSDRNALVMVEKALSAAGHDTRWLTAVSGRSASTSFGATSIVTDSIEYVAHSLNDLVGYVEERDMVIVHGDRHEVLGAAVAANIMGIPIAHIGGGDLTEGSQDDCFRHAITKLSHLHFASNQESADRIVQMGEEPDRVRVTGCPGIDMVMATETIGREDTFDAVGLIDPEPKKCLLVLFHPNTLGDTAAELEVLSVALARRAEALVLLGPNADAGGDLIRREWQRLAQNRPDTVYHDNVEPKVFYSLLKWCDVLIGNSSAAFYEAPCFGTRCVNLGDRQRGRTQPRNVINLVNRNDPNAINAELSVQIKLGMLESCNPYGDGYAAERIAKVIGGIKDPKSLLRKKFHEVPPCP